MFDVSVVPILDSGIGSGFDVGAVPMLDSGVASVLNAA